MTPLDQRIAEIDLYLKLAKSDLVLGNKTSRANLEFLLASLRKAVEALELVDSAKCYDSCAHPQSVWWQTWVQEPVRKVLADLSKMAGEM